MSLNRRVTPFYLPFLPSLRDFTRRALISTVKPINYRARTTTVFCATRGFTRARSWRGRTGGKPEHNGHERNQFAICRGRGSGEKVARAQKCSLRVVTCRRLLGRSVVKRKRERETTGGEGRRAAVGRRTVDVLSSVTRKKEGKGERKRFPGNAVARSVRGPRECRRGASGTGARRAAKGQRGEQRAPPRARNLSIFPVQGKASGIR